MELVCQAKAVKNRWAHLQPTFAELIRSRTLTTDEELKAFCRLSNAKLPRDLDIAYAKQGQCLVFCRASDPTYWYGGVIINSTPAFRSFALYSEDYKHQLLAKHRLSEHDMVEISCLWMNVHRIRPLERIWIYAQILYKAYATGKNAVVAFCFFPKLQVMQRQVLNQILDEGTACTGRDGQEFMVQSYYARRRQFAFNVAKAFVHNLLSVARKSRGQHAASSSLVSGHLGLNAGLNTK